MSFHKPAGLCLAVFCLQLYASLHVSCGRSPIPESYRIRFPPLPSSWRTVLGENRWRLDYYDDEGVLRRVETDGGVEAAPLVEWPSALLAWPYWPEKNLDAELFYPAGALLPFDRDGNTITLRWEAGAEAYFYHELDKVRSLAAGTKRKPELFDWPRFRSFLRATAPEAVRIDPWLADWKSIAEKSVRSGFRQSFVRADDQGAVHIRVPDEGPWIGASPFCPALSWTTGDVVTVSLASRPLLLVCPGGRMRVSKNAQVWVPFP